MGKLDEILGLTDEDAAQMTEDATETDTNNSDADNTNTGDTGETEKPISLGDLERLQRENAGLLKGMKEERKKRQDFQSRLDVLTGTVNAILEKRGKGAADPDSGDSKKKPVIAIEVDEDGNDVLPVDKLETVLSPYKQEIMNLRQLISAQHNIAQNDKTNDKALQIILGEDERYPKAYTKYSKARNWANQQVVEWQQENGWQGPMTGEQALEMVFEGNLEAEFSKQFPGADLEAVVGQTKRSLRKALKSFAEPTSAEGETATQKDKGTGSRFQKVLNKPSGLAGARNAKGGNLSVTEKVGELSSIDIMSLSDKEADALMEALLAEEKSGGIKF